MNAACIALIAVQPLIFLDNHRGVFVMTLICAVALWASGYFLWVCAVETWRDLNDRKARWLTILRDDVLFILIGLCILIAAADDLRRIWW